MTEQGRPGRDEDRPTVSTTGTGATTDTPAATTTAEGTDAVQTENPTTRTTTSAGHPQPVTPGTAFPAYPGAGGSTAGAVDPAPADPAAARRRGPDPLALLVGLVTLAMAVFAFVGELPDLPDPRWLLAGGAALVGLVLLVGSLRGRRGPHGG